MTLSNVALAWIRRGDWNSTKTLQSAASMSQ